MPYYDLPKTERELLASQIAAAIADEVKLGQEGPVKTYFSDPDTYIRKVAYQAFGKIYRHKPDLLPALIGVLEREMDSDDERRRQSAVNAAGELGIYTFGPVQHLMDRGLFDAHHSVRNAVIGSIKKMGEKNPLPVLAYARLYLHHEDKEIRREICHGIELRGRKHPQDILPLLRELQHDKTRRVRSTLVHVLGQIAYKKGCLATVLADLKGWDNQALVAEAIEEIIDVHDRYKNFAAMSQDEAKAFIASNF